MKRLIVMVMLTVVSPALAQSNDQFWQQFVASREAQCGQDVVSLAKQLNDEKAKNAELEKKLSEKKK